MYMVDRPGGTRHLPIQDSLGTYHIDSSPVRIFRFYLPLLLSLGEEELFHPFTGEQQLQSSIL
jgi:hypothetical protein